MPLLLLLPLLLLPRNKEEEEEEEEEEQTRRSRRYVEDRDDCDDRLIVPGYSVSACIPRLYRLYHLGWWYRAF